MTFQHCPESPLVKGNPQPCLLLPSRNGRVACCWCGKEPRRYELSEDGWNLLAECMARTGEEIDDGRSAGVILLLVGLACGFGIGLVLAWAVMS